LPSYALARKRACFDPSHPNRLTIIEREENNKTAERTLQSLAVEEPLFF